MMRRSRISVKPNFRPGARSGSVGEQPPQLTTENDTQPKPTAEPVSSSPSPHQKPLIEEYVKKEGVENTTDSTSEKNTTNVADEAPSNSSAKPAAAPQRRMRFSAAPKLTRPKVRPPAPPPSTEKPSSTPPTPAKEAPVQIPHSTSLSTNSDSLADAGIPDCTPTSQVATHSSVTLAPSSPCIPSPEKSPPSPQPGQVPQRPLEELPPLQCPTSAANIPSSCEKHSQLDEPGFSPMLEGACSDKERILRALKLKEIMKIERRKDIKKGKRRARRKQVSFDVLDRSKMTMRDLIYYLPDTSPMKSLQVSEENSAETPPPEVPKHAAEREEEEEEEEESEDEHTLVPKVRVAEDGSIILDEESLTVRVQRTSNTVLDDSTPLFERGSATTYLSFRNVTHVKSWSVRETDMFYLAISMVGTDFSLIGHLFPHRSRREIRNKFKKEERTNGWRIDKAFREKRPYDKEFFSFLLEKVLAKDKEKRNSVKLVMPKKPRKARGKKTKNNVCEEGHSDDVDLDDDNLDVESVGHVGAEKENEDLSNVNETNKSGKKKCKRKLSENNTDGDVLDEQIKRKNKRSRKTKKEKQSKKDGESESGLFDLEGDDTNADEEALSDSSTTAKKCRRLKKKKTASQNGETGSKSKKRKKLCQAVYDDDEEPISVNEESVTMDGESATASSMRKHSKKRNLKVGKPAKKKNTKRTKPQTDDEATSEDGEVSMEPSDLETIETVISTDKVPQKSARPPRKPLPNLATKRHKKSSELEATTEVGGKMMKFGDSLSEGEQLKKKAVVVLERTPPRLLSPSKIQYTNNESMNPPASPAKNEHSLCQKTRMHRAERVKCNLGTGRMKGEKDGQMSEDEHGPGTSAKDMKSPTVLLENMVTQEYEDSDAENSVDEDPTDYSYLHDLNSQMFQRRPMVVLSREEVDMILNTQDQTSTEDPLVLVNPLDLSLTTDLSFHFHSSNLMEGNVEDAQVLESAGEGEGRPQEMDSCSVALTESHCQDFSGTASLLGQSDISTKVDASRSSNVNDNLFKRRPMVVLSREEVDMILNVQDQKDDPSLSLSPLNLSLATELSFQLESSSLMEENADATHVVESQVCSPQEMTSSSIALRESNLESKCTDLIRTQFKLDQSDASSEKDISVSSHPETSKKVTSISSLEKPEPHVCVTTDKDGARGTSFAAPDVVEECKISALATPELPDHLQGSKMACFDVLKRSQETAGASSQIEEATPPCQAPPDIIDGSQKSVMTSQEAKGRAEEPVVATPTDQVSQEEEVRQAVPPRAEPSTGALLSSKHGATLQRRSRFPKPKPNLSLSSKYTQKQKTTECSKDKEHNELKDAGQQSMFREKLFSPSPADHVDHMESKPVKVSLTSDTSSPSDPSSATEVLTDTTANLTTVGVMFKKRPMAVSSHEEVGMILKAQDQTPEEDQSLSLSPLDLSLATDLSFQLHTSDIIEGNAEAAEIGESMVEEQEGRAQEVDTHSVALKKSNLGDHCEDLNKTESVLGQCGTSPKINISSSIKSNVSGYPETSKVATSSVLEKPEPLANPKIDKDVRTVEKKLDSSSSLADVSSEDPNAPLMTKTLIPVFPKTETHSTFLATPDVVEEPKISPLATAEHGDYVQGSQADVSSEDPNAPLMTKTLIPVFPKTETRSTFLATPDVVEEPKISPLATAEHGDYVQGSQMAPFDVMTAGVSPPHIEEAKPPCLAAPDIIDRSQESVVTTSETKERPEVPVMATPTDQVSQEEVAQAAPPKTETSSSPLVSSKIAITPKRRGRFLKPKPNLSLASKFTHSSQKQKTLDCSKVSSVKPSADKESFSKEEKVLPSSSVDNMGHVGTDPGKTTLAATTFTISSPSSTTEVLTDCLGNPATTVPGSSDASAAVPKQESKQVTAVTLGGTSADQPQLSSEQTDNLCDIDMELLCHPAKSSETSCSRSQPVQTTQQESREQITAAFQNICEPAKIIQSTTDDHSDEEPTFILTLYEIPMTQEYLVSPSNDSGPHPAVPPQQFSDQSHILPPTSLSPRSDSLSLETADLGKEHGGMLQNEISGIVGTASKDVSENLKDVIGFGEEISSSLPESEEKLFTEAIKEYDPRDVKLLATEPQEESNKRKEEKTEPEPVAVLEQQPLVPSESPQTKTHPSKDKSAEVPTKLETADISEISDSKSMCKQLSEITDDLIPRHHSTPFAARVSKCTDLLPQGSGGPEQSLHDVSAIVVEKMEDHCREDTFAHSFTRDEGSSSGYPERQEAHNVMASREIKTHVLDEGKLHAKPKSLQRVSTEDEQAITQCNPTQCDLETPQLDLTLTTSSALQQAYKPELKEDPHESSAVHGDIESDCNDESLTDLHELSEEAEDVGEDVSHIVLADIFVPVTEDTEQDSEIKKEEKTADISKKSNQKSQQNPSFLKDRGTPLRRKGNQQTTGTSHEDDSSMQQNVDKLEIPKTEPGLDLVDHEEMLQRQHQIMPCSVRVSRCLHIPPQTSEEVRAPCHLEQFSETSSSVGTTAALCGSEMGSSPVSKDDSLMMSPERVNSKMCSEAVPDTEMICTGSLPVDTEEFKEPSDGVSKMVLADYLVPVSEEMGEDLSMDWMESFKSSPHEEEQSLVNRPKSQETPLNKEMEQVKNSSPSKVEERKSEERAVLGKNTTPARRRGSLTVKLPFPKKSGQKNEPDSEQSCLKPQMHQLSLMPWTKKRAIQNAMEAEDPTDVSLDPLSKEKDGEGCSFSNETHKVETPGNISLSENIEGSSKEPSMSHMKTPPRQKVKLQVKPRQSQRTCTKDEETCLISSQPGSPQFLTPTRKQSTAAKGKEMAEEPTDRHPEEVPTTSSQEPNSETEESCLLRSGPSSVPSPPNLWPRVTLPRLNIQTTEAGVSADSSTSPVGVKLHTSQPLSSPQLKSPVSLPTQSGSPTPDEDDEKSPSRVSQFFFSDIFTEVDTERDGVTFPNAL